jgi:hypothetical protein
MVVRGCNRAIFALDTDNERQCEKRAQVYGNRLCGILFSMIILYTSFHMKISLKADSTNDTKS